MLKTNKIIKELKDRLDNLEAKLDSYIKGSFKEREQDDKKLSYEEVVDQWLNGTKIN